MAKKKKEKSVKETQLAGGTFDEIPHEYLSAVMGEDEGKTKVAIVVKVGNRVSFLTMEPDIADTLSKDLANMVIKAKKKEAKK